jgi:hypothetical protein
MSRMEESLAFDTAMRLSAVEAQDEIAATFADFEKLAWRYFVIARDLGVNLDDEDFPDQKPGAHHLRWFTALGATAIYTELIDLLAIARKAATRTDRDLMEEWLKRQPSPAAAPKAKTKPRTAGL